MKAHVTTQFEMDDGSLTPPFMAVHTFSKPPTLHMTCRRVSGVLYEADSCLNLIVGEEICFYAKVKFADAGPQTKWDWAGSQWSLTTGENLQLLRGDVGSQVYAVTQPGDGYIEFYVYGVGGTSNTVRFNYKIKVRGTETILS